MQASAFWLQLEAQNFSSSIFDTQDLSTIRGGSLLLRDLVYEVDAYLREQFVDHVEAATLGGSIGVWRLTIPNSQAQKLGANIRTKFNASDFKHVGFGIAIITESDAGYRHHRAELIAVLQRQRLQQTRIKFPELENTEYHVCPIDLVRPEGAKKQKVGPGQVIRPSESVYARRKFGIEKKQSLIEAEIGSLSDDLAASYKEIRANARPFAMQINSISEGAAPPKGLKSNLEDKICIITLDGNGFGKIQDLALSTNDTIEGQRAFDQDLAKIRAGIVKRVYTKLLEKGGIGPPSEQERIVREELHDAAIDNIIRFEMLLWGGDEIMFIVPARIGWELIVEASDAISSLRLNDKPVTFSIGAVFCHHDAPISRIKHLADSLAEHVKSLKIKGLNDNDKNIGRDGKADTLILPQVLESFDHIGNNLDDFLKDQWPKPTEEPLHPRTEEEAFDVLELQEMCLLRNAAQDLASGIGGQISRGRLRKTAHALQYGKVAGAQYSGQKWVHYISSTAELLNGDNCLKAIEYLGRDRFFVLLERFWDYLVPIRATDLFDPNGGDAG